MSDYLFYLGLTLFIESVLVAVLAWMAAWSDVVRIVQAVIAVNLVSHPLAWGAYLVFGAVSYWPIEILVVAFEAAVIARLAPMEIRRALVVSLVTNGATMAVGWLF